MNNDRFYEHIGLTRVGRSPIGHQGKPLSGGSEMCIFNDGVAMGNPCVTEDSMSAYRLFRACEYSGAAVLARRAAENCRKCNAIHSVLALSLFYLGRAAEAEEVISEALQLGYGDADAYDALAYAAMLLGEATLANELYRRAAETEPNSAQLWYNYASSERSLGKLDAAEVACNASIEADPRYYLSYLLRSDLRTQTVTDNHTESLSLLERDHRTSKAGKMILGYCLAKEYDDLKDYNKAFAFLSGASKIRRQSLLYDVSTDEKKIQRIVDAYPSSETVNVDSRHSSSKYIFIVGLPRSGTTLVERVVSGLPNTVSNGETDNFQRALLMAAQGGPGRDIFEQCARVDPSKVAENYIFLANRRNMDKSVIEKMPLNYLYIAAIAQALPKAKIILLERSPMDSCFAMYRTLFSQSYPFTYDFDDLARYYAAYRHLIAHWQFILGDRLCRVSYEQLVREPEKSGERLASFCGLEWQKQATHIEENGNASWTASASQIRRPIHVLSLEKWRNYEPHLLPLQNALELRSVLSV